MKMCSSEELKALLLPFNKVLLMSPFEGLIHAIGVKKANKILIARLKSFPG
jgi:hypothetical protein